MMALLKETADRASDVSHVPLVYIFISKQRQTDLKLHNIYDKKKRTWKENFIVKKWSKVIHKLRKTMKLNAYMIPERQRSCNYMFFFSILLSGDNHIP